MIIPRPDVHVRLTYKSSAVPLIPAPECAYPVFRSSPHRTTARSNLRIRGSKATSTSVERRTAGQPLAQGFGTAQDRMLEPGRLAQFGLIGLDKTEERIPIAVTQRDIRRQQSRGQAVTELLPTALSTQPGGRYAQAVLSQVRAKPAVRPFRVRWPAA